MTLAIVISVSIGLVLNSMLLALIVVMYKVHEGQHCADERYFLSLNDDTKAYLENRIKVLENDVDIDDIRKRLNDLEIEVHWKD